VARRKERRFSISFCAISKFFTCACCNSLTSYNGGRAFHTTLASSLELIVTFAPVNERFCIAASTSASSFHESEESVRESYNPCVIVTESTEDLPSEELITPPSDEDPLFAPFSEEVPLKTSEGVPKRCAMLNSSSSLLRFNLIFAPREGGRRILSSSDSSPPPRWCP
jgi:hypothetical protein